MAFRSWVGEMAWMNWLLIWGLAGLLFWGCAAPKTTSTEKKTANTGTVASLSYGKVTSFTVKDGLIYLADAQGLVAAYDVKKGRIIQAWETKTDHAHLHATALGVIAYGRWCNHVVLLEIGKPEGLLIPLPKGRTISGCLTENEIWMAHSASEAAQADQNNRDSLKLLPTALLEVSVVDKQSQANGPQLSQVASQVAMGQGYWVYQLVGETDRIHAMAKGGGHEFDLPTQGQVQRIQRVESGRVICATSTGLYDVVQKPGGYELRKVLNTNPKDLPTLSLCIDPNGLIYIATPGGVFQRKAGTNNKQLTQSEPIAMELVGEELWILEAGAGIRKATGEWVWAFGK